MFRSEIFTSGEIFSIVKIPFIPGTYQVYNTLIQTNDSIAGALFGYIDYDEFKGNYTILESDSSSFVTLESYDTITKEIKGRFDLTFIKDIKPYPEASDTIRFRDGYFHTKIIN